MKVKISCLLAAMLTLASLICLSSCSEESEFEKLDSEGYTISVKFDAGGGTIKGSNSTVIDVFNPANYEVNEDGMIEISLITPDDERRDKNNRLTISKSGESFIGWYREKNYANGVDDTDGYVYSGLWDFENDRLVLDPNGDYTSAENRLTLYAAWAQKTVFNIYTQNDDGENILLETKELFTLNLPKWEDQKSQITMGDIGKRSGYTFSEVYSDEAYSELVTAESIKGYIDIETGRLQDTVINLYTTWEEGTHYRIYAPKDLTGVSGDGIFHIMNDLDFSGKVWAFPTKFSGKIYGEGHTISNVTFETAYANTNNGLFAEITADAQIRDIVFENVTHTVNVGLVKADTTFGLFAGRIADGALLENVSVSGRLLFGEDCLNLGNYSSSNYSIGIFAADGTPADIDTSAIEIGLADPSITGFTLSADDSGNITLVFENTD